MFSVYSGQECCKHRWPEQLKESHFARAPEDEVDVELCGDGVDGEILTVEAHVREQVQLVPAEKIRPRTPRLI